MVPVWGIGELVYLKIIHQSFAWYDFYSHDNVPMITNVLFVDLGSKKGKDTRKL